MKKGELIEVSVKELRRAKILDRVLSGERRLTSSLTGLGVCYRQAKRMKAAYQKGGLAHENRGRILEKRIPDEIREQVVALFNDRYEDFNDLHFTQKLNEQEGIDIGRENVPESVTLHELCSLRAFLLLSKGRKWRERSPTLHPTVKPTGNSQRGHFHMVIKGTY